MNKQQEKIREHISLSNKKWKTIITFKKEERNLLLLFHYYFFESLLSISFVNAKWIDRGYVKVKSPEYEVYLEKNQFGYQKIIGFWDDDAFLISKENKAISLSQEEKDLLVELLSLFGMNRFIDKLEEYQK